MRHLLKIIYGLVLLPTLVWAQTATPTATHTPTNTPFATPFVVGLAGFNLEVSSALPRHQLGIPYWGKEGAFVYTQATVTVTAGQWVVIDKDNKITLLDNTAALTPTASVRIGVVTAGASTTSPYVWVWEGRGTFLALVTNGVTAGSYLTTTAVDGTAGTGGVAILGCSNNTAGVTATRVSVKCVDLIRSNYTPPTPAATSTP